MKITKEQFKKLAKKHLTVLEGYDINKTIEIFGIGRLYDEVIKIEQQINKNKAKEFLIERSEGMTTERIKEIQEQTAYPESASVMLALMQVWNECEQEQSAKNRKVENIKPEFKRGDILASKISPTVLVFDKYTRCGEFDSIINNSKVVCNNNWNAEIFRHASAEEIEVFYKDLARMGKKWNAETLELEELEELDISEIVVDYESAIKYLGIKDNLLIFKNDNRTEKFNAQIRLQVIAEAWNKFDGFEADWESPDQWKHYPIFRVGGGKIEFSYLNYTRGILDSHKSNFSFKTEERAKQFGEQFIDLFKVALGF